LEHPGRGAAPGRCSGAKQDRSRLHQGTDAGRGRPAALAIDETDGVSLEFADWRFNLRSSNTEPLRRLNVETRGDSAAVAERVAEVKAPIRAD
jgi:phosphomannomutase